MIELVNQWLEGAPGRLRDLWILRGVTGNELAHRSVVEGIAAFDAAGLTRLGWREAGDYDQQRTPRLEDAVIRDGQLRVAVFGEEYDVLAFNIANAKEVGIPEAAGMTSGDEEHEALVAYPYGGAG